MQVQAPLPGTDSGEVRTKPGRSPSLLWMATKTLPVSEDVNGYARCACCGQQTLKPRDMACCASCTTETRRFWDSVVVAVLGSGQPMTVAFDTADAALLERKSLWYDKSHLTQKSPPPRKGQGT